MTLAKNIGKPDHNPNKRNDDQCKNDEGPESNILFQLYFCLVDFNLSLLLHNLKLVWNILLLIRKFNPDKTNIFFKTIQGFGRIINK